MHITCSLCFSFSIAICLCPQLPYYHAFSGPYMLSISEKILLLLWWVQGYLLVGGRMAFAFGKW